MDLNHARLPIPPYPHIGLTVNIIKDFIDSVKDFFHLFLNAFHFLKNNGYIK